MNAVDEILNREKPEPQEGSRKIPWPLLALWTGVTIFACSYYLTQIPNDSVSTLGDLRSSPSPAAKQTVAGDKLFAQNCAACHQPDGKGIPGAFPPLAGSSWVTASPDVIGRILLYGVNGPIKVSGKDFNGQMPNFGARMDDEQIAAIASYVRTAWGNQSEAVNPGQIAKIRSDEKGRSKPWQGEVELRQRLGQLAPP